MGSKRLTPTTVGKMTSNCLFVVVVVVVISKHLLKIHFFSRPDLRLRCNVHVDVLCSLLHINILHIAKLTKKLEQQLKNCIIRAILYQICTMVPMQFLLYVNHQNNLGQTPILLAVYSGNLELVKLFAAFSDCNLAGVLPQSGNFTSCQIPLHRACLMADKAFLNALLSTPTYLDVDKKDHFGKCNMVLFVCVYA